MAQQWTPQERDAARQRVGTATTGIAILAVGAAGAASILAWHATTDPAAATTQPSGTQVRSGDDQGGAWGEAQDDDQGGGNWSGVSGGNGLPGGGIQGAAPPGQGAGGGSVRSQGS